jgi:hypothetical protein
MSTAEGGGNIVTDGLVLCLDAANSKSIVSGSTTWTDLSRGGNNGTLVNGPAFNSANGGSIVFDGSDDYVNCGNSSNLQISVGSISAWIKRNGNGTRSEEIYIHKESGIIPFGGFQLWIDRTTLKVKMRIRNSINSFQIITTNTSITTGLWVNIIGVFDGNTVSIYLNGIEDVNVIATISSLDTPTQVLSIGAVRGTTTYNFNGNVSQTLIYNRALSSQEVLQNFNASKTRFGL